MTNIARRWRRPGTPPDDAGITMIEIVVAMTIMMFVTAVVTTGMLQMYRASNRNQSAMTAQSQVQRAFVTLDKEVRYAEYISTPAKVGTTYFAEYQAPDDSCWELALLTAAVTTSNGVTIPANTLVLRSWPGGTLAIRVIASNVATVAASGPFIQADTSSLEGLEIQLKDASTTSESMTDTTFIAMNSGDALTAYPNASARSICTTGRSTW
jgi:type II secretory pathway pseudopilin PulG